MSASYTDRNANIDTKSILTYRTDGKDAYSNKDLPLEKLKHKDLNKWAADAARGTGYTIYFIVDIKVETPNKGQKRYWIFVYTPKLRFQGDKIEDGDLEADVFHVSEPKDLGSVSEECKGLKVIEDLLTGFQKGRLYQLALEGAAKENWAPMKRDIIELVVPYSKGKARGLGE